MGAEQIVYSEGDTDWFATFLHRCEIQSKGYIGLTLTNFTTSAACAVANGSIVEINGAVFEFSAETSITGSVATGTNYIVLSVTDTTASPYFSQAAGTWDADKHGWYTDSERYVGKFTSDGTTPTYDNKLVYPIDRSSIDRNGNEVISMRVETKYNNTAVIIPTAGTTVVTVSGYSWTPDALLNYIIYYGTLAAGSPIFTIGYNTDRIGGTVSAANLLFVSSVTFSSGQIDLEISNVGGTGKRYIEMVMTTAATTS